MVDGATKTSTEPLTEVGDSVNSEPPAEGSRNLENAERKRGDGRAAYLTLIGGAHAGIVGRLDALDAQTEAESAAQ